MTNAAYDLSRFETRTEPRIREIKNTDREIRDAEDRKFRVRFAVLFIAVICLAVYTVYSNMLLTKTKSQITRLNAELTEIKSENVYLDYQIESMFSVENAEDYAVNELGLIKLDGAQVEYVNLENENVIVRYDSGSDGSFQSTMSAFLDTVMDVISF